MATPPPVASVGIVRLHEGNLVQQLQAFGSVQPASDAQYTLSVQAQGRVSEWWVANGSVVRKGQPLARFALSTTAVAAYRQATAAVRLAMTDRLHTQALLARQLATRDQLAQSEKLLNDAMTVLQALRANQGDKTDFILRAPWDGTVIGLDAVSGEVLPAGVPLARLVRVHAWKVRVGLEATDGQSVRAGDDVSLHGLDSHVSSRGHVLSVGRTLDPVTHQLVAWIDGAEPLTGEESVRADIKIGTWHGWLVPRAAVLGEGPYTVYQVDHGHAVKIGVKRLGGDDVTWVLAGRLDPALPLVVVGADQLDDGMAVKTQGQATL
ncbi:efflux RND transporter periplasmic adaptor subunit [Frateuria aurantia]